MERGFAVIRAFSESSPALTVGEVARLTSLTRSAARRFLLTLVDLGYVRSVGRTFMLTPRVLELGYSYLSSLSLPAVAQPHLEQLVAEVHESTSVCVLDDQDVVYVTRVPVSRIMTVSISVGTRFPAYATSMGRVLLAGLGDEQLDAYLESVQPAQLTSRTKITPRQLRAEIEQVRKQGWAIVDQELEDGLRSVAAPIRDKNGVVVAAVNISTHAGRTSLDDIRRRLLPPLRATAARIEADLYMASGDGRPAA